MAVAETTLMESLSTANKLSDPTFLACCEGVVRNDDNFYEGMEQGSSAAHEALSPINDQVNLNVGNGMVIT